MYTFGVISKLKESTMEGIDRIINVINEDYEEQWPKDTTLWNT